jgi:TetR/AcrR family transcriptional repressor of nem operon
MTPVTESGTDVGARRGRPREFDNATVLAALVDLFWQKGFGATSMTDIVEVSGLSKSSLYNSFGSKEELFGQALDLYIEQRTALVAAVLRDGSAGLDDIDAFLDAIAPQAGDVGDSRGCLAVNTSTELGSCGPAIVQRGDRYRSMLHEGFAAAIDRAVILGEVDADDAPHAVNTLVCALLGIAVIVRSGAESAEVRSQVESLKHALR